MTVLSATFHHQPRRQSDYALTRMICFALVAFFGCRFQRSWSTGSGVLTPFVDGLALIAIAIAVWHGAYDGVLARPFFKPRFGKWWIPAFAAGYLLLAGAVLFAWNLSAEYALIAFLIYSSWHFGTEQDLEPLSLPNAAAAFALGALPIAAACHWHPDQVSAIFGVMTGSAAESAFPLQITRFCGTLLWVLTGLACAGALPFPGSIGRTARLSRLCLIAIELLLFWYCDPVLGFAIYFCCWHTPEHLVSSSRDRNGFYSAQMMFANLRAGMFPWLASLAGLAGMLALRPQSLANYVSAIFIFLSALTVPHMVLNEVSRLTKNVTP
jgi:Brp/Blh family beta-carotene 15,15'-monooxygenase